MEAAEEKIDNKIIPELSGLIHYHQLYSLKFLNYHFQTYLLSNYVIDELKAKGNMLRASYAISLKGLSLIFLGQYEAAKKLYDNLYLYSRQLQNDYFITVIKNNIILNEFAAKHYMNVIELINQAGNTLPFDLYHLAAFSYLRLKQYDQCIAYINHLNPTKMRYINIKLIKMIQYYLQNNLKSFLEMCQKLLDFYIKDNDIIMLYAVYDFLIEYFEESNNLKALIKVQRACLKLNNPKTDNTILNKIKFLNQ